MHGDIRHPGRTLAHWEGYRGSGPVRIGNGAIQQFQSDIYGEFMDSLYLYNKHVSRIPYDFWAHLAPADELDLRELAAAGPGHLGDAEPGRSNSSTPRS